MAKNPIRKPVDRMPIQRPWFTWRKAVCAGALLLLAGYIYGRPTLETWLGMELPAIMDTDDAVDDKADGKADNTNRGSSGKDKPTTGNSKNSNSAGFERKSIGGGRFETPEGLVFNQNRLKHVMLHAKDDPGKPTHGIFDVGTEDEVLMLIDRAYAKAKDRANSRDVKRERQDDRDVFTVNMRERIGYLGGKSGQRNGKKPCNFIRIVVDDDVVITAFPLRN